MTSPTPKARFKILYKIILTFVIGMIIPITLVYYYMTNQAFNNELEKLLLRLNNGEQYLTQLIFHNKEEVELATQSMVDDLNFRHDYASDKQDKKDLEKTFYRYITQYQFDSIQVFDLKSPNRDLIFHLSNDLHPDFSVDDEFIMKGSTGQATTIDFLEEGIIIQCQQLIFHGKAPAFLLKTKTIVPPNTLDVAKRMLDKNLTLDFSLAKNDRYIITSMYNAYGENLVNQELIKSEPKPFLNWNTSEDEEIFLIEHLNQTHLVRTITFKDEIFANPMKAQIMIPYSFSNAGMVQRFLSILTAVVILIIILASIFLSRNMVKPIFELMKGISYIRRRIKEANHFYPLEIRTRDEFAVLAHEFNDMGVQLTHAYADLSQYNARLEEEVEKRTYEIIQMNKEMVREMKVAQQVQEALLPTELINYEDTFMTAHLKPMTGTSGDFYDIINLGNNRYGVSIIDVSGHGVPSALITTMAKVAFGNEFTPDKTTGEICTNVNANLQPTLLSSGLYFTGFICKLDFNQNLIEYTNAGHHAGIVFRKATKEIIELNTDGFLIGVVDDMEYETGSFDFVSGDRLILYTDGIVEARNADGAFFGEERLLHLIRQYPELSCTELEQLILEALDSFCGDRAATDDRTLILIDIQYKQAIDRYLVTEIPQTEDMPVSL